MAHYDDAREISECAGVSGDNCSARCLSRGRDDEVMRAPGTALTSDEHEEPGVGLGHCPVIVDDRDGGEHIVKKFGPRPLGAARGQLNSDA